MAASIKPTGIHYHDRGHPADTGPIGPTKIVSGKTWVAPSTGSYKHAATTWILIHLPNGDLAYGVPTSNNPAWRVYDPKNGYASPQIDDGVGRGQYKNFAPFDSWLKGSPPPSMNEYVFHHGEPVAIRSIEDRLVQAPSGEIQLPKRVHDYEATPINAAGRLLSQIHNTIHRMGEYSGTELAKILEGGPVKRSLGIDNVAIGGLPEEADYGITRLNGKIVLQVSPHLYERASKIAAALGISTEAYLSMQLGEEHRHRVRGSFDKPNYSVEGKVNEERGTKDDEFQALEKLAKGAEGGNVRNPRYHKALRELQILAALKRLDRDTVKRYKEIYGSHAHFIADESDKASFEANSDGRITATYEGRPVGDDGASMPTYFVGKYLNRETDEKSGAKVDPSQIKSMSDAKQACSKDAPKEEAASAD